jgi:hypothetical protein
MVQLIDTGEMDRSICGPVVENMKQLIATILVCSVVHVCHELNETAHLLACSNEFFFT